MKQFSLLILLLSFCYGYSQPDKIEFTKKITYSNSTYPNSNVYANIFYSPEYNLILFEQVSGSYLIKDGNYYSISLSLDKNAILKEDYTFAFHSIYDFQKKSEQILYNQNINGYKTTKYTYNSSSENDFKGIFFIDENNDIDLVKIFAKNSYLQGLPIRVQLIYSFDLYELDEKNIESNTSTIDLQKIEDINEFIYIDNFASERQKLNISTSKLLEVLYMRETEENYEIDYDYDDSDEIVLIEEVSTKYISQFKNDTSQYSRLAIDNADYFYEDSPNWEVIPEYCKNLDNLIPSFKSESLKARVRNYAGQICDMYYGEHGYIVAYKETLNQIRKETLHLFNNIDSLDKNDKKLLLEFLNQLD